MLDHLDDCIRMAMGNIDGDKFRRIIFQASDKRILVILNSDRDRSNQALRVHPSNKGLAGYFIKAVHDIEVTIFGQLLCNILIHNGLHICRNHWQFKAILAQSHCRIRL